VTPAWKTFTPISVFELRWTQRQARPLMQPIGPRNHTGFIANSKDKIQGLYKDFKDLKLQFSSTKSIDRETYHTHATSKFRICNTQWEVVFK